MADQDPTTEPVPETQAADAELIGGLIDGLYAGDDVSEDAPAEEDQAALGDVEEGDELEADDAEEPADEENTDEPEAGIADSDLQTLKRAGFSEERIAKMSPELAAELAEDAREAKRANDREYQEYLAQKRKAETDETERQEASAEAPQPSVPNLPDLAALSQPFAEDLGVEPEQLTKFAEAITNAATAQTQEQLQQLSALNQRAVEAAEEALVDSAVSRLSGDFPQLRSSESLSSIVEKTRNVLLANPKSEGSIIDRITAAMRDVASVEFKDEIVKREVDRKDKQRQRGRQRAKGQPTPNARRGGVSDNPDAQFRSHAAQLLDDAGI